MSWPSYRNRYLPAFTLSQIHKIPDKEKALVVIPTGAIEQHGPHLPVGVDALLAQIYLDRALPKLPAHAPVFVAPPIQAGKSNEHDGFPGTIILSRETLRQQMLCIGRQIHAWGFKRIGVLNTHGGNTSVLKSMLRELHMTLALEVQLIDYSYEAELSAREAAYGIHAGEVETALMLAATPNMVDPSGCTTCWIGDPEEAKELQPEFAAATFAWKTLDLSASGVMGDAKGATKEKGERWLARLSEALAQELLRLVSR